MYDNDFNELKIDLNIFFPFLHQTNPEFNDNDKEQFLNDDIIKVLYCGMIDKMLFKYGIDKDDDFKYQNNEYYKYINPLDRAEVLTHIKNSVNSIFTDDNEMKKYSKMIGNIIDEDSKLKNILNDVYLFNIRV